MKRIICEKCGDYWYVKGERVPWENRFSVHRSLLICSKCGWDNSKAAKRERAAKLAS